MSEHNIGLLIVGPGTSRLGLKQGSVNVPAGIAPADTHSVVFKG
jgi:hypothetical protein